jgi:S1-C subfamily serine protease
MMRRLTVLVLLLLPVVAVAGEEKAKKAYLGVMIGLNKEKGTVIVLAVLPDSPAQKAGVKPNDVLVRIDGAKATDLPTTVKVIQAMKPGKKVKLEVSRDGKPKTIEVVPGELGG